MKKIRVLFVCLGNICRSPTAEAVLVKLLQDEKTDHLFEVDSAGTSGFHDGELPDPRSRKYGHERGYQLSHISRKLLPEDLETFDHILAMDSANLKNIFLLQNADQHKHKIKLLTDYSLSGHDHVPDPYYGGPSDFHQVIDIIEECCRHFLDQVKKS